MSLIFKMFLICTLAASCAFFKSKKETPAETTNEPQLTYAEEFGQDPTLTEAAVEAPAEVTTEAEPEAASELVTETPSEDPLMESAAPVVEPVDSYGGGDKTYTVKKNETLMMVAFNVYGDYDKWKEIAEKNQDTLKGRNQIRAGMELKYAAPSQEFIWNPEGNPYLIKHGDSLSGISGQVYNNRNKWRSIWENNKPLIKNPNRIFAGFTLYYLDLDKVASTDQ